MAHWLSGSSGWLTGLLLATLALIHHYYQETSMLTTEDQLALHQLISLYGHIIDERQFSRSHELFTHDVRYDVTDFNAGVHVGIDAIIGLWKATDRHPLAHHATNIIVTQDADGTTRVVSKGIGVLPDGKAGTTVYKDIVVKTSQGWRIKDRVALRRSPEKIPVPS